MITSPGAMLRTVINRINWIDRAVKDPPSPRETEISWAWAGSGSARASKAIAKMQPRARMVSAQFIAQIGDFGQANGQLAGNVTFDFFQFTSGDEFVTDI